MAPSRLSQLLLFALLGQAISQDIRSFDMSVMDGWQLTCANTTCLPFSTLITPSVRDCRLACLSRAQCRTASFQWILSRCALFTSAPNSSADMTMDPGIITSSVSVSTGSPTGEYDFHVHQFFKTVEASLKSIPIH